MTIGKLKEILNQYNDDEQVVICAESCNSSRYVDAPARAAKRTVSACFGDDYEAVCIFCPDQVGSI